MKKATISLIIITLLLIIIISYTIYVLTNNANLKSKPINFKILFTDNEHIKIEKLIDKNESSVYNYNIYTYCGEAKIDLNGTVLDLKTALQEEKINMDTIINQCIKDTNESLIQSMFYKDGGTTVYMYNDYWIIKANTEIKNEENRDVYITKTNSELSDIYIHHWD